MKRILFPLIYTWMVVLIVALITSCATELEYISPNDSENPTGTNVSTIIVTQPGQLKEQLPADYLSIKSITVKGPINSSDLKVLRYMAGADEYGKATKGVLSELDLSEASIVEGGEPHYIYEGTPVISKNNQLPRYAFGFCSVLETIFLPENLTSIGSQAFYGCSALIKIDIPKSVTSIERSVFVDCIALKEATLPQSVISLDDFLFYNCISLTTLSLSKNIISLGKGTFYKCSKLKNITEYVSNVEEFGRYAFAYTKITRPIIPQKMKIIPDGAFYGCSSITEELQLHEGVDSIGYMTFKGSSISGNLILPKSLRVIGQDAFRGTDIESLTIQSDINANQPMLSDGTFSYCSRLSKLTIAEGCSFLDITFPSCKALSEISLPSTLKRIGRIPKDEWEIIEDNYGQFRNCTALRIIQFPNGLTGISNSAFKGCTKLASVVLPEALAYLGSYAFKDCSGFNFTSINIPSRLNHISQGCFSGCSYLKRVLGGENVTSIGYEAFSDCENLQEFVMPQTLTDISDKAFSGCTNITRVAIPENVKKLGNQTFLNCQSLRSVIFECSLNILPVSTFSGCTSLSQIELPKGLKNIEDYAFYGCTGLTELLLPPTVETLGKQAFSGCRSTSRISIPETVTTIREQCFNYCIGMKVFRCEHHSPLQIPTSVFDNIDLSACTLEVPEGTSEKYRQSEVWSDFGNIISF